MTRPSKRNATAQIPITTTARVMRVCRDEERVKRASYAERRGGRSTVEWNPSSMAGDAVKHRNSANGSAANSESFASVKERTPQSKTDRGIRRGIPISRAMGLFRATARLGIGVQTAGAGFLSRGVSLSPVAAGGVIAPQLPGQCKSSMERTRSKRKATAIARRFLIPSQHDSTSFWHYKPVKSARVGKHRSTLKEKKREEKETQLAASPFLFPRSDCPQCVDAVYQGWRPGGLEQRRHGR